MPRLVGYVVAPMLVAVFVLSVQAFSKPARGPAGDEFYYMTMARDLTLYGVITNGTFKAGPFNRLPGTPHWSDEAPEWAKPGRFFAPAYPVLVHLLGKLAPALAVSVRCHVKAMGDGADPLKSWLSPAAQKCPKSFMSLIMINTMAWAAAMLALFLMALDLSRSQVIAWLSMLIALGSGVPGYYAGTYLSENIAVPAFILFMLFAMRAIEYGRGIQYVLAGAAMGVAILARPAYFYLFVLLALLVLFVALAMKGRRHVPSMGAALAFVAATLVILAPWMIRNQMQFGDPLPSRGYAEVILIQRLAYNQMSWGEWAVAWLYWLPDFGDGLAKKLFAPELWQRLNWNHPQNYYMDGGAGAFRQNILRQAPSDDDVMPLLLHKYLIGDLVKHVMVSLPLSMRGMGVGKYLSVAGVVLFWPVARAMRATGKLIPLLAIVLPAFLMVGLHGFVSVNIIRYNLPLLVIYSFVVAYAVNDIFMRVYGVRKRVGS